MRTYIGVAPQPAELTYSGVALTSSAFISVSYDTHSNGVPVRSVQLQYQSTAGTSYEYEPQQ